MARLGGEIFTLRIGHSLWRVMDGNSLGYCHGPGRHHISCQGELGPYTNECRSAILHSSDERKHSPLRVYTRNPVYVSVCMRNPVYVCVVYMRSPKTKFCILDVIYLFGVRIKSFCVFEELLDRIVSGVCRLSFSGWCHMRTQRNENNPSMYSRVRNHLFAPPMVAVSYRLALSRVLSSAHSLVAARSRKKKVANSN